MARRKRPDPGCRIATRLREPPFRLYKSEQSAFTVLVDRFASEESERALAILANGERIVRAFRVRELLDDGEIQELRDRTDATDWWTRGLLIDFGMDGRSVTLTTLHARRIEIALESS